MKHRNVCGILNQEDYLHICRQAYMFKMFAGEDKNLQHYLLLIKLSETKRDLTNSKYHLAEHLHRLITDYKRYSVEKGLVFSSKAFRRKSFIKQAGSFIKELCK